MGLRNGNGFERGGSAWRFYSLTFEQEAVCVREREDVSNGTADWAVLHELDRSAILNSTCGEEQLYQGGRAGQEEVREPPEPPAWQLS